METSSIFRRQKSGKLRIARTGIGLLGAIVLALTIAPIPAFGADPGASQDSTPKDDNTQLLEPSQNSAGSKEDPGADETGPNITQAAPSTDAPIGALANESTGMISITRDSVSPQPSGSPFDYIISFSCSGAESLNCENLEIRIPLDSTTHPSMVPSLVPNSPRWNYSATGSPNLGTVTTETVGTDQVIRIGNSMPTGSSETVRFRVTPPNGETFNDTTWELLPALHSSSFTEPATAPEPADGWATAAASVFTGKSLTTGNQTVVQPGQKLTYRLVATCYGNVWVPNGHLYLQSARISDTLPLGVTFIPGESSPFATYDPATRTVSWDMPQTSDLPLTCGGPYNDSGNVVGDRLFQLTVRVDSDVTEGQQINNQVQVTGIPLGQTDPISASTNLLLTAELAPQPWPGGESRWVSKGLSGTIKPSATYAGNWVRPINPIPRNDNNAVEAVFDVTVSYNSLGFRTRIVDPLPCLDTEIEPGVFASSFTPVCDSPAFHTTTIGIRDWNTHASNNYQAAYDAGWRPKLLLTDGSTINLNNFTLAAFESWAAGAFFPIPAAYIGQVAGVILDPNEEIAGSDIQLRISGYADASLDPGDRLRNIAEVTPYRPDGSEANAPYRVQRELSILAPETRIGIIKSMQSPLTPGQQTSVSLQGRIDSPLTIPGPLVLTDLLPAGYTYIGPIGPIGVSAGHNGEATSSVSASVEAISNYQGSGRQLLRATIQPTSSADFSSGYWYFSVGLQVSAPTLAGSATNTAQSFLPNGEVADECSSGTLSTDNALDLDGSGKLQAQHCEAVFPIRVISDAAPSYAAVKTVQGDLDPAPRIFPNVGVTRLAGGSVEYGLTWTNTGGGKLSNVVVYDVLPFIGDLSVIARGSRHSEFRPTLQSIESPSSTGVELSFSTSNNPCQPEIVNIPGCENPTWSTTLPVGGIAEVRSLRLASNDVYESGESFSIRFRMSVPDLASSDQIAWNNTTSHAWYQAGSGPLSLEPAESPVVGLQGSHPEVTITKADAAGNEGDDSDDPVQIVPGEETVIRLTVTNTGNNPLKDFTIGDQLTAGDTAVTDLSCDFDGSGEFLGGTEWAGVLQPDRSFLCEGNLGVLDLNSLHGDLARVDATGTLLDEAVFDEDPYYAISEGVAKIQLTKRIFSDDANTAPGPFITVGTPAQWFYEVSLPADATLPLTDVSVRDDNGTPLNLADDWDAEYVSGDTNANGTLDSGEVWLFQTPALQQTLVEDGSYGNNAVARGEWAPDREVTDTDPAHLFGAAPSISLVKYTQTLFDADGDRADPDDPWPRVRVGDTVRWTYKVTNTGNVPLVNINVTDDRLENVEITCHPYLNNIIPTLGVGAEQVCQAKGTATEGSYANTGSVVGTGPETLGPNGTVAGAEVTDDNPSHYFGALSSINIVKTVNTVDANNAPGPFVAVGGPVVWQYTVTNTGNTELTDIVMTDDRLKDGEITCEVDLATVTLAPDASFVCEAEGTATPGSYVNIAEVTGTGPETVDQYASPVPGETVTDSDPANHFGAEPAISLEKLINGKPYTSAPGLQLIPNKSAVIAFLVTNTGNVVLEDVFVVDNRIAPEHISCEVGLGNRIGILAIGQTVKCQATLPAIKGGGTQTFHHNTAVATGTGPETLGPEGGMEPGSKVQDDAEAFAFVPVIPAGLASTGFDGNEGLWLAPVGFVMLAFGALLLRRRGARRRG